MNCGVLKLVLLFVVEDEAMFLDVADNWCLPSGTLQECDKAIEDPILCAKNNFGIRDDVISSLC